MLAIGTPKHSADSGYPFIACLGAHRDNVVTCSQKRRDIINKRPVDRARRKDASRGPQIEAVDVEINILRRLHRKKGALWCVVERDVLTEVGDRSEERRV